MDGIGMAAGKDKGPGSFLDWMGLRGAQDWTVARPLGPLFTLVLALLFLGAIAAAFGVIWHTVTNAFGTAATGPSLGAGAMIAALLGAPFVIWATVLKQKTVEFQKEGHITDRINKAVEMLGAEKTVKRDGNERTVPNIEVRIGALLSLERIAQDSTAYDKGRDHVRVMEILCAYVRENAKAEDAPSDNPRDLWEKALSEARAELEPLGLEEAAFKLQAQDLAHKKCGINPVEPDLRDQVKAWVDALPPPRADIQLALTIIGRRSPAQRHVEARWGPDAAPDAQWVFDTPCPELPEPPEGQRHGLDKIEAFKNALARWRETLRRYRNYGYRLDLRGINLQKADLSGLILSGADLSGARMEGAVLRLARMQGASLSEARMEGADLSEARMQGAVLSGARMERAVLRVARMQGASLSEARMEGADLRLARMEGADLSEARMEGANLRLARMEGAVLRLARMQGITSLNAATFHGAAFKDVSLLTVPISEDQVKSAYGDASVTLPEGMAWPEKWPTWRLPFDGEHGFYDQWRRWQADPTGYTPPPKPEDTA
nr:pentapeptide repeat-containing protein [Thetidibacter halocola]